MSSSISTMYASMSSPFILTPARSIDCAFSLARLSAKRLVNEAATSFHSRLSAVVIPPCICRASHRFTAIAHSLTLVPLIYVRKNIAHRYGLIMRALSLLIAQYNSHLLMKRVVFFLSPSYIVGGSPTNFPACTCGRGSGGGPQPPPVGFLLLGRLSCGSRIGGSSGSCSGPPLGGSGLSGSCARRRAASSSAFRRVLCPVCGLISSTCSRLR